MQDFTAAVAALRRGGIIAYPTEGVWGLGCDPDDERALSALIALKGRASEKGLILIAGDIRQLAAWLEGVDDDAMARLAASWPGPNTWLIPDNGRAAPLLRGSHSTLAVRVSDHPLVQALCAAWGGPLVSTSANRAGEPPAMSASQVRETFGEALDAVVEGPLGGRDRPSTIRDLMTNEVLRA
ncbi:MAG: L-threonylcarbamoyladenylate synthase [Pseudomonadota bacterium]|uniref:L-threonylcarbamoyladenylate synthase n=1 Tax=Salinicola salarius TaxID=430457 RepID=UPI0023E41A51|nr:L-threonylcarbamoyladenylate synthase [Salinicola salarius]MDF3920096.1 L-threonylcarbamoyladenylate synthase [Salinicola salarius]MEC8918379.1 L-threonylcarbamoyladenylate synthase [Pseudomonadota bacterium]